VRLVQAIAARIRARLQQRQSEETLQASDTRFRALIENSMDLIVVLDAHGRLTYRSPSASMLGYRLEELLGRVMFDYVHPDDADRIRQAFARAAGGSAPGMREEFRFRHKEGSWRTFEAVVTNLLDEPAVKGLVINARDITERRKAEEALRRSEEEHRGLIERAPLGIYRTTPEGRLLAANPTLAKMLGYERPAELLGQDVAHVLYPSPEVRARVLSPLRQHEDWATETEWKRKDGRSVAVRLNVHAVRGSAGEIECFEGLAEDVTEQRSLEAQFRQAQRLEAVGRLAGGVAHDFNNILTAISGYSELLLADLSADDPKREDVTEIRAAARRAAALTRQLLAFGRKQVLEVKVLDLNAVVQTLERMLRRLMGEDVRLELALSEGLGAVQADPAQLEQVIMNLAVNARDAMPAGGHLTIETANVVLDELYARTHQGAKPGQYVMLALSDTGIGMDRETQSHIFEPFFTTKDPSKGTGLGLATVYGIVKQSGGNIWVYSEPERGATFRLYLPRVDEQPDDPGQLAVPPAAGGHETVLLAEDDASVREAVARSLEQKGYRVLRASGGRMALDVARAHTGKIALLVTDLVMPEMTGGEVALALLAQRPDLRVIYMSGYADEAVVRHGVLEKGLRYLQKPFSAEELARKVREVLDAPPSRSRPEG
jgi:PAS domain S-box-containing protein